MIALTIPQVLLLLTCMLAFTYGLSQSSGTTLEKGLILLAGIATVLLELLVDYLGSILGMIPTRAVMDVLMFKHAPLGDVLIPIGYSLIAVGIGSLLRQYFSALSARLSSMLK